MSAIRPLSPLVIVLALACSTTQPTPPVALPTPTPPPQAAAVDDLGEAIRRGLPATPPATLPAGRASREATAQPLPLAELREAALRLRRGVPLNLDTVATRLDALAAGRSDLDWRRSVVDLLKLTGADSSFHARATLASDPNYAGTAAQNVRLHAEVLARLASMGVPAAPQSRAASREATDSTTPLRPAVTRPPDRRIVFGTSYEDFKPLTANQAAALAAIGFDVVRPTAIWAHLNPARGVYDWSKTDADFAALRAAGLRIIPSVAWPPAHASGGKPAYLPYTDGCTRWKVGATTVFDIEFNDALEYCRNPPHIDEAAAYEFGFEFEKRYGPVLLARAIGNEPGFRIFWPPDGPDSMFRYVTEYVWPMTRGMLDAAAGTQPAVDPETASKSGDLLNGGVPAPDGRIEMLITLPATLPARGWLITAIQDSTLRPYRASDVAVPGRLVVRLNSPCAPGAIGPRPVGPVQVALQSDRCIGATCDDAVLLFDGEPNQQVQCGGKRRAVTPGLATSSQHAGRRAQFVGPEADSAGVLEELLALERELGLELYDAVTWHPYPWPPEDVFTRIRGFEAAAAQHRDARPQWYSESGGMDVIAFIRQVLAGESDVSLISIGDFRQWFVDGSWDADAPVLNARGLELQKIIRDAVAGRPMKLHVDGGGVVVPFRAAESLRTAA